MKVLFLDIDGVLNRCQMYENMHFGIVPECVENLNLILKSVPDLQIVISSAWRYAMLNKDMTVKGFEYMLLISGVNCQNRIYDHTVADEIIPTRGAQIRNWLDTHAYLRIDKYLALDDLIHDFPVQKIEHLQTEPEKGLTKEKAEIVIRLMT